MENNKIKSNLSGAIRRTLKEEMELNPEIFLFGEDIADPLGGIHRVTKGLTNTFGEERVMNSPLSEIAIVGTGIGAAMVGMKPIVEIMYSDFLPICMDQIANIAGKAHFLSGGHINVPVIIRAKYGSGTGEGAQHSQDPVSWLLPYPGIKILAPSTPRNAQGLLKAAMKDNNPIIFLEHKMLYNATGEIDEVNTEIEIGKGEVVKEGKDITVVALTYMLHFAIEAAKQLAEEGIDVEVIDPRTVKPLDEEIIINSVKKTHHLLTVDEGCITGGFGSMVSDVVTRKAFDALAAAPIRLGLDDMPLIGLASGESMQLPSVESIKEEIKKSLNK